MRDIWNPWHGCTKCSEGCQNCYMYDLDARRGQDGSRIYRTGHFDAPLRRDRSGNYKIRSGEMMRVCMTSDFFLEEADCWRAEAWDIIHQRPDVVFFLLTKRPQRVEKCLPKDWGDGWENVFFNVTCENQRRAEERMPLLLTLPFRHKGVMCAPLIGPVSLEPWLISGQVEQVMCGGENYGGARPCDFDWVRALSEECGRNHVRFCFLETGTLFIKDGKRYHLTAKRIQSEMALKAGVNIEGKPLAFRLTDPLGIEIPQASRHVPVYGPSCAKCSGKMTCNGCSHCGKCAF